MRTASGRSWLLSMTPTTTDRNYAAMSRPRFRPATGLRRPAPGPAEATAWRSHLRAGARTGALHASPGERVGHRRLGLHRKSYQYVVDAFPIVLPYRVSDEGVVKHREAGLTVVSVAVLPLDAGVDSRGPGEYPSWTINVQPNEQEV